MKLIIGCVIYNNEKEVETFLENLSLTEEIENILVGVYVNSYTDNIKKLEKKIKEIKLSVKIFYGNENLGYLKGSFKAIELLSETADYYMISNTDVAFQQDFFKKINQKNYKENVGVIAPSILSLKSSSFQNPHYKKRITSEKMKRLIRITSHPAAFYIYNSLSSFKSYHFKKEEQDSQTVYSPHGSCFILSNQFYEYVKNIYFEPVMYSEESFIGEELIISGYVCYYDQDLKMSHDESTTTSLLKIKKKSEYFRTSLSFIYEKYYMKSSKGI